MKNESVSKSKPSARRGEKPPADLSGRSQAIRGHSFEEKPEKPADVEEKEMFHRPIEKSNDHTLRPNSTRGQSYIEKPEQPYDDKAEEMFHMPIEKSNDHALRPQSTRGQSYIKTPEKPAVDDDDSRPSNDISWKKPDWATGSKLKSTGKAHLMKTEGNLAAPITNLPHSNPEGNFAKPEWTGNSGLRGTDKGEKLKSGENLSRPIGGIKRIE
jgi:hypothetical protein